MMIPHYLLTVNTTVAHVLRGDRTNNSGGASLFVRVQAFDMHDVLRTR